MIGSNKGKRVDWLADVVYPLVVVLMEAFWVYPWLIWLGHLPLFAGVRAPVSLLSVIIILAASFGATRFFSRRDWPMGRVRAAIIGCGIIFIFLVFRVEFGKEYPLIGGGWFDHIRGLLAATFSDTHVAAAAIPVSLFLWWRGILLERRTSSFESVYRSFNSGIVALIGLFLAWYITYPGGRYQDTMESIRLYAICFFCSGLTALAVGNLCLKRRGMIGQDHGSSVWRSLTVILGVIAAITLLGFLAAALFSPQFFDAIGTGLTAVWSVITRGLYYIAYPFVYVAALVFRLLKRLVALFRKSDSFEIQGFNEPFRKEIARTVKEMPGIVTTLLQLIAAAALFTLVILIIAKAVKRFRGEQDEGIEEIHESVLSLGALRKDLEQLLKTLGRMFERKQKSPVFYDDKVDNLSVREIYKRLLWEGWRKGIERRKYETPLEYAERLKLKIPEGKAQLYEITDYYSEARYGDKELSAEGAHSARGLWVVLRSLIRRIGESDG